MDRIEKCNKVYTELFGGEPATMESGNDPELMIILQRFIFGEVFETGTLDKKMRELLTAVCLAVIHALPQLKAHVQAALNAGNSPLMVRETIYQCAPIIGFPRTLNAVSAANEVFLEGGISLPLPAQEGAAEGERYEKGLALQFPLYGMLPYRMGWKMGFSGISVYAAVPAVLCVGTADKTACNLAGANP